MIFSSILKNNYSFDYNIKYKNFFCILSAFLLFFSTLILSANDDQSRKAYAEGIKLMENKKYRSAADKFKDAILYADTAQLKANGLKMQAEANKKGDLLYQEYLNLKRLIANYPENCDVNKLVEREYQIGNNFFDGYREVPFKWFPWITDEDKSKEIYEAILKQSPYAKFIPEMLVKMGFLYLKDGENQKAIAVYDKVITNYEHSDASQVAHLDLANIYLQLAKTGDGDGSNSKNARRVLLLYIKRFPKTPEIKWAKSNLKRTYELEADRLYNLAIYYNNNNNQKAAKRYIKQILVNYPDTKCANKAESLLDAIDLPLYPMTKLPPVEEKTKYNLYNLPQSDKEDTILVVPENTGGKWLIPIKDLGLQQEKKLKNKYMEKL
jgi:outer membrane protein assembly factor BamD (BamD/ComL family)